MIHLRYIGQLEAYIEEEHAGQRHTITAILPREEVEELYRRLSGGPELSELESLTLNAVAEHMRRQGFGQSANILADIHSRFPPKEPQP